MKRPQEMKTQYILLLVAAAPAVKAFAPVYRSPLSMRRGSVNMLSLPRFGGKKPLMPPSATEAEGASRKILSPPAESQKTMGATPDFALISCFALWYLVCTGLPQKDFFSC